MLFDEIPSIYLRTHSTVSDALMDSNWQTGQGSGVITTRLSDFHKTVLTFFSAYFSRIPPKTITYRNFRYFETRDFLHKLENKLRTKECNGEVKYNDSTNIFRSTLDSDAPLKQKQVRENQALFMTKELSKAIMRRSRIKSKGLQTLRKW